MLSGLLSHTRRDWRTVTMVRLELTEEFQKMSDLSDQDDLSARRIADAAKQMVISWLKWIIGHLTVIAAILGIKEYSSLENKINNIVEKQVTVAVDKAVNNYKNFNDKMNEGIINN